MKVIRNVNETLKDDLALELQKGSMLSIVAADFSTLNEILNAKFPPYFRFQICIYFFKDSPNSPFLVR